MKQENKPIYALMNIYSSQFYKPIIRDLNYSKQSFLWCLFNKYGFNDLKICSNFTTATGDLFYSPWLKFEYLLSLNPNSKINELQKISQLRNLTRDEFIEKASHRSILDIEIMIDIDEAGDFDNIKEKAQEIYFELKENNIPFSCYFSGNKSYHFSIILPHLRNLSEYERLEFKRDFLQSIGADGLKAGNTLISMENSLHRTTGKEKVEVCLSEI